MFCSPMYKLSSIDPLPGSMWLVVLLPSFCSYFCSVVNQVGRKLAIVALVVINLVITDQFSGLELFQ